MQEERPMTLPYLQNLSQLARRLETWCVAVLAEKRAEREAVDLSEEDRAAIEARWKKFIQCVPRVDRGRIGDLVTQLQNVQRDCADKIALVNAALAVEAVEEEL